MIIIEHVNTYKIQQIISIQQMLQQIIQQKKYNKDTAKNKFSKMLASPTNKKHDLPIEIFKINRYSTFF